MKKLKDVLATVQIPFYSAAQAQNKELKAALSKLVATVRNQDLTITRPGVDMAAFLKPFSDLTA